MRQMNILDIFLKPCPFCGDPGKIEIVLPNNPDQDDEYYVACTSCGAQGGARDEPGKAAYWWNRRAP